MAAEGILDTGNAWTKLESVATRRDAARAIADKPDVDVAPMTDW